MSATRVLFTQAWDIATDFDDQQSDCTTGVASQALYSLLSNLSTKGYVPRLPTV